MNYLRFLGYPFALMYGMVTYLRNLFYDKGWMESRSYPVPVICVGNLSVGGTGKSPMIAYIVEILKANYRIAVLSRGYKRKTKGYLEVSEGHTATEVGDEPLQLKKNHPDITVAVCADRRTGIENLGELADVILLDDGFQHRKVKPAYSILLTQYGDLYLDDYLLPMGRLREPIAGAGRADMIVVTKCPEGLAYAKQQEIQFRMKLGRHQRLYFSKVSYDTHIYGKTETLPLEYLQGKPFSLVTGIAKPDPLLTFLERKELSFTHERFPDHHNFSVSDIQKLSKKEIILTTEKDYMRLQPLMDKFALYYLPIKTVLLNEQEEFFGERLMEVVSKNSR